MNKQTVLNLCSRDETGTVLARFALRIVEGENTLSESYHRLSIPSDGDASAIITDVSASLVEMGWPAISDADGGTIVAVKSAGP